MGLLRVYIAPTLREGGFSDYVEVTDDVFDTAAKLKQKLDNDDFDVGLFTFNKIALNLRNEHGNYSEVGETTSIFKFTRANSKVKITWHKNNFDLIAGFFRAGYVWMHTETTLFVGTLEDTATRINATEQSIKFQMLPRDSVLNAIGIPFASLAAGNDFKTILYETLNQTKITNLFNVNLANINPGTNLATDAIASLEDKTGKQLFDEILFLSNSVLYIEGDDVIVKDRTPNPGVAFTFYGQASDLGIENLIDIKKYSTGINKTFNQWIWQDTGLKKFFIDSIENHGLYTKSVESELITDTTKRNTILTNNLNEFGNPAREMTIEVPIDEETIKLKLLDGIKIDYPGDYFSYRAFEIPRYGSAIYDEAVYPVGQFALKVFETQNWKITGRSFSLSGDALTFDIREF